MWPRRRCAPRRPDRTDLLIAELQDRIRALEEANRENRRIIAALTQRIPELTAAATESREDAPQQAAETGEEYAYTRARAVVAAVVRWLTEHHNDDRFEAELRDECSRGFWAQLFGGDATL